MGADIPEGCGNLAGGEERQRRSPRNCRPSGSDPSGVAETRLGAWPCQHPSGAPTALGIATATASGLNANLSYTSGGGSHATSLRLLWRIVGVDADFTQSTPVLLAGQTVGPFLAGQTVEFKTRAENSVGSTDSAVKTVSF